MNFGRLARCSVAERIRLYKKFSRNLLVPEALARRREIGDGAKLLYAKLRQYEGKNGEARPKIATLAADLGKSRRRIEAYIAELVKLGLIEVELRRASHRPSRYVFLDHPWLFDREPNASSDVASDVRGHDERDVTARASDATDDVSAHVATAVAVDEGQRDEGQETEKGHSRNSAMPSECVSPEPPRPQGLGATQPDGAAEAVRGKESQTASARLSETRASESSAFTGGHDRDGLVADLEAHYQAAATRWTGTRQGKWARRERKVACELLAGHEADDIKAAVTFMFEKWPDLGIPGVPHLGLLLTGWGPGVFSRSQGFQPLRPASDKTGRMRGEYDRESADRSPIIGWGKRARAIDASN